MMRLLICYVALLILGFAAAPPASAMEIKLVDGTFLEGEVVDIREDGIVVRREDGGYSDRIHWSQLSQETLKKLAEDPEALDYADPYIVIPPEERRELSKIPVQNVERAALPKGDIGMISSLMTPMGIVILGVLMFANIYIAFQIAAYRNQAPALVCAVSAVIPVIGPIIFLSLPSREHYEEVHEGAEGEAPPPPPPAAAPAAAGGIGVPGGGGLAIASRQEESPAEAAQSQTQVFKADDHQFNRRFIEATFSGFFRVVPRPQEKDLVLVFKTHKQNFVAKRISRISSTDLHIQLQRGGEHRLGFNEIHEIQIRHKDAKH